jgi:hypothetical protein
MKIFTFDKPVDKHIRNFISILPPPPPGDFMVLCILSPQALIKPGGEEKINLVKIFSIYGFFNSKC